MNSIRVIHGEKPSNCHVQELLVGHNDQGSVELARRDVKRNAVRKKIDTISYDEEIRNGNHWMVKAMGYYCD